MGRIYCHTCEIVSRIAKAARRIGELEISVPCHEAYDWLKGGGINDHATACQRNVWAVVSCCIDLAWALVANQHVGVVSGILVNVDAHAAVECANELGVGWSLEGSLGCTSER